MSNAKVQALLTQALAQHRAGRLPEAEVLYTRLRALAPKQFDAFHLGGLVAYQRGKLQEAIQLYSRAQQIDPRHAVCAMRLGLAYLAAQEAGEAERHLRRAVALDPTMLAGWENLAHGLKLQDRLADALVCHQKVVTLKPDHAAGWYGYGLTLSMLGRIGDALSCHERALAADPSFTKARFGRAQALQQAQRIPEAVAEFELYLQKEPGHHEAQSSRLFALLYLDGMSREWIFAEHVAYGKRLAKPVALIAPAFEGRRIKVGIVSPDLRLHSCAYFIEPILRHLDREAFSIHLYHDHFREDAMSARLKAMADGWQNIGGQTNAAVEQRIRADAPDILVDLAGHTAMTSRLPLFARRLAPVQITYLGYPETTGVPAMDFRFTDAVADPEGEADAFATEKLVRFATTAWAFQPSAEAPEVMTPLASDPARPVTFGCFNNLSKVTDRVLALWGRLLANVPQSRLVLKGRGLGDADMRARFLARCEEQGLPADRLDLIERTNGVREHLELYHGVDITLDTFPYNGTTTTCEALWMGRPVVTLKGDSHRSRVGASLLSAIGHPEWVAESEDGYLEIAGRLANDREALVTACGGLREAVRGSDLFDHKGQATRFGDALKACWAEAISRETASPF